MGCDIHGIVEVKEKGDWYPTIIVERNLLSRDYRAFAILFGPRNTWDFKPLFADRGFPKDLDYYTKRAIGMLEYDKEGNEVEREEPPDGHSLTYVTLKELHEIPSEIEFISYKWNDELNDKLKKKKSPMADNVLNIHVYENKLLNDREMFQVMAGIPTTKKIAGLDIDFFKDKINWRETNMMGMDPLFTEFKYLIELMDKLKERFEDIRLLIWFDN